MVSFLKGRRRTDDAVVAVDSSGAHITLTLETLVARAEQAIEQLRALSGVLERSEEMNALRERCEAVEQKVAEMEGTQARIAAAESQIQRVAGAGAEIDQLQGRLGEFGDKIDAALKLREQIEGFLSLEGPIGAVRTDAEGLRKQLDEMGEDVTRMRTQADDALRAHRHSTARLEHFNEEYQTVTSRLDEAARRVQVVERALEPVGQAVTAVPDLQHRLAVLKALADQVAQKSAALEQQREAVDRAATQISQLTRLDRELDAWLRRQEEQIRRFGQIEAKITEVHAVQAKVMGRSEELQQMATQTEEAQQAARQSLNDLREQMRKSSESFELENRGLHAVSERVADLRNAVKECESRFAVLDAASQGTATVTAQVRSVGEQAGELAAELSRLLEEEKRISSLRQEVGRLDGVAAEVTARMGRIEELRPAIESAVKDLGSLKGTRELMADGLEQMRVAYEEISRLRESHGEVETWLTNTDTWTKKVQGQVKELSGMEPAVERIREEVEQVKGAMVEIEARRETLNDVQRRLGDLGAVSAELKERADALRGRMETAESRFTQLAKQAEEAQLVADTMAEVTGSVSEAEKRMSTVDDSVRGLESRTSQLDELQDRIRLLGQELDQRQGALDKATEHLTRASALRQEAAETAQRLEEVCPHRQLDARERRGALRRPEEGHRRSREPGHRAEAGRAPARRVRGSAGPLGVRPGRSRQGAGTDPGPAGSGGGARIRGQERVRAGAARGGQRPDHRLVPPRDRRDPRPAGGHPEQVPRGRGGAPRLRGPQAGPRPGGAAAGPGRSPRARHQDHRREPPGAEDRRGPRHGVGRCARSPDEAGRGADPVAAPGALAGGGPQGRGRGAGGDRGGEGSGVGYTRKALSP